MTPNEPRQWERESSTPWCISKGSAVCVLVLSLCVLALSGWSYLSYQRMNELDARMVEFGLSKRINVEQKTTPPILQRENEAMIYTAEIIEEEPPPPTEKRREVPLVAVPDKKQPVVPVVEKSLVSPAFKQFKRQCLLQGGGTVEVTEGVEWVCSEKREPYKEQPVVPVVE